MTEISKTAPAASIRRAASVALGQITLSEDFWFREGGINVAHQADLASTIRNTGKALDPVLLWQQDETEPGKLILLDGAHRIEAYRAARWAGTIPALILVGADRRTALGAALKANSKRALGLSQAERMDAAWRLVREPVVPRFKVNEIAFLADVAGRTVDYMRARFRTMHEEGIEITGSWAWDRRTRDDALIDALNQMTDAQRKSEIEKLAADIRDLFDRRKHPERVILSESEAVWEAVQVALGEKAIKDMLAYLLVGEDEADEWLEMATAGSESTEEGEDGDEPEPAF